MKPSPHLSVLSFFTIRFCRSRPERLQKHPDITANRSESSQPLPSLPDENPDILSFHPAQYRRLHISQLHQMHIPQSEAEPGMQLL